MKLLFLKYYFFITILIQYYPTIGQSLTQVKDYTLGSKGTEFLTKSIVTRDGGVLSIGHTSNFFNGSANANYDYFIVKTDSNDELKWTRSLGSPANEFVYDVKEDTIHEGFIILGYTESQQSTGHISTSGKGGATDIWVVKLSSDGQTIIWEKRFGGDKEDYGTSIIQISNGNFLIAGFTNSEPGTGDVGNDKDRGYFDYRLICIDESGFIEWDRRLGGSGFEGTGERGGYLSVLQTSDGGYIVGGRSFSGKSEDKSENSRAESSDIWIIKLDAALNIQWDTTLGGIEEETFSCLTETSTGEYILAGTSASEDPVVGYPRKKDYWVIKLNKTGLLIWDHKYGGSEDDELVSLTPSLDGGYLLGGTSYSDENGEKSHPNFGNSDYWMVKLNADGIKEWDAVFGGIEEEYLSSILFTDQKIVLAGTSNSNVSGNKTASAIGEYDFWLVNLIEKPLPIELISFQASIINNLVELSWITSSETNNAYFTIERSSDAISFYKILEIQGSGTLNHLRTYSALDKEPTQGLSYYRLKQTDFDGKFTYSKIVSVQLEKAVSFDFSVFPNPSDGMSLQLSINDKIKQQDFVITVDDISGHRIFEKKYLDSHEIIIHLPISRSLKKGIYILTIFTKEGPLSKNLVIN